eukprot:6573318-Prymnesium_polylepis.1
MKSTYAQRIAKAAVSTWMKQEVRGKTPSICSCATSPVTIGTNASGVPAGGVARWITAAVRNAISEAAARGVIRRGTSSRSACNNLRLR